MNINKELVVLIIAITAVFLANYFAGAYVPVSPV